MPPQLTPPHLQHFHLPHPPVSSILGTTKLHASHCWLLPPLGPTMGPVNLAPCLRRTRHPNGKRLSPPGSPLRHPPMAGSWPGSLAFDSPLAPWTHSGAVATLTTMRDQLGPEAEPLASWIAHESIEGITPAQCTQIYLANRIYTLWRRTLETSASSRDSIRLSFQE
jgi:hypothetical protein